MKISGAGPVTRLARILGFAVLGAATAATPRGAPAIAGELDYDLQEEIAQASPAKISTQTEDLFRAIRANDIGAVEASVENGADIMAAGQDGLSALDVALANGYFDIARYLMNVRTAKRTEMTERLAEPAPARTEEPAPIPVSPAPTAVIETAVIETAAVETETRAAAPPAEATPARDSETPKVTLPLPPPAPKEIAERAPQPAPEPAPAAVTPAVTPSESQTAPSVAAPALAAAEPERGVTEAIAQIETAAGTETANRTEAPPPRHHVIRRGETLTRIAARYAIAPEELMRLNNIGRADHILVGNRLVLPPDARDISPQQREPETAAQPKTARAAPPAAEIRPPETRAAPAFDPTESRRYDSAPVVPVTPPPPLSRETVIAAPPAPEQATPAPASAPPAAVEIKEAAPGESTAENTAADEDEKPDLLKVFSRLFGGNSKTPAADAGAETPQDVQKDAEQKPKRPADEVRASEAPNLPAVALAPMPDAGPPPQAFPLPREGAPAAPQSPPPAYRPRPIPPPPEAAPVEIPPPPVVDQDVAVQNLAPAVLREGAPPPPPPPEPKNEEPKEPESFFTAMKQIGTLFKESDGTSPDDEFFVAKTPEQEAIELRKDGTISVAIEEIESPVKPPDAAVTVEEAVMLPANTRKIEPPVAPRAINPFDPNNAPVGSTLPIVDPIAGDHPELGSVPVPQELPRIEINEANRIESPNRVVAESRDIPKQPDPRIQLRPVPRSNFDHEPSQIENLMSFVLPDGDEVKVRPPGTATEEQTAALTPPPVTNIREPLNGTILAIGGLKPGDVKAPPTNGQREACVQRPGSPAEFCIVPIGWPDSIGPAFNVSTILYQGTRAIVRFDNNQATHIHTLFNSGDHRAVIQYFLNQYGQETDVWLRTIAPFNRPREANPTRIWRSIDPNTNIMTVLEVRLYDDTRSTFPDTRHGVVRLYSGDAKKLFPNLSTLDIMSIDWAARADIPDTIFAADGDDAALANMLPARR